MTVDPEAMTVDELLAVSVPEGSVFDELSRISATASAGGVEVTVNLEGRLTALELAPHTLRRTPAELAAEIFRLTQEASASALAQGTAALAAAGGEDLAAELAGPGAVAGPAAPADSAERAGPAAPAGPVMPEPKQAPKPAPKPAPEEDFSAVERWALPR